MQVFHKNRSNSWETRQCVFCGKCTSFGSSSKCLGMPLTNHVTSGNSFILLETQLTHVKREFNLQDAVNIE